MQQLYQQAHAEEQADKSQQAVADYRKILRLDPGLPQAYNNLGRLLFNLGEYGEAVPILQKGLTLAPEMHGAQIMLGASLLDEGKAAEAVAPLQAGAEAMPNDRFAHMTLARALVEAHRPAEAVAPLNAVLKADPHDQEAWYTLGKLHLQLSQQALSQVQAIDPNTALAHELAGEVMESMQNTPGAVAEYKSAAAVAPGDPKPLQRLADLYWSTGDWAHARESYEALLKKQPANCVARWHLANSLDELSEASEEALREINMSLERCPALPQAHAERARLLLRSGKAADALKDLQVAEQGAPDEPSVQRMLAQAYRALGQPAKAEQANLRFQQLDRAEHAAKEQHAASVIRANQ